MVSWWKKTTKVARLELWSACLTPFVAISARTSCLVEAFEVREVSFRSSASNSFFFFFFEKKV